jgi:hypothetical protein
VLRSINFKEMPDSWKNGNRKVLRIGRKTNKSRKIEKSVSLSLSTSKLKASTI